MKAAFMTGVDAVEVRKTEEPTLDPYGAVLKVEACGICGTDARTFFNGDPRAPSPWILGHEPVGTLEEVGPHATLPAGIKKGDRVFLGSILTCGRCRFCMDGFQNLCDEHLLYGYDPYPGAYADYAAVPPIAIKNLIPLPPDLPSDLATVADPFACALNGIEMLDIRLGDNVLILGAGPIGCWQAVMARDRGATKVFLSDVNRQRLDIALGAVGPSSTKRGSPAMTMAWRRRWSTPKAAAPSGSASRRRRSRRSRPRSRWRPSGPRSSTSRACPSTTPSPRST